MTKLTLYFPIAFLTILVALIYLPSCTTDKCEGMMCYYGGTCDKGKCKCPPNTSGTNCEIGDNKKFEASYTGFDDCDVDIQGVQVTAPTADPTAIIIKYIGTNNEQPQLSATISGNSISIPTRMLSLNGLIQTYSGTGSLNNGTLTIYLTVSDNGNPVECTFVGNK